MIEIKHLNKTFALKEGNVDAVQDVSLSIREGEIYGVIGNSGAGKSTLVRCLNLLEVPDSGELTIKGSPSILFKDGSAYIRNGGSLRLIRQKEQNQLRRGIGMIFQHFNLLDRSTVFENVAYPLRYSGMSRKAIEARVRELLELVELSDKIDAYPSQLSGGQKQRVSIARALANHPRILLSDEATSALDPDATESILGLLKELNAKLHLTIVLITHEMAVIKSICGRVAVMENGRLVEEGEVYNLFSHPKEAITRRFVASSSPLSRIGHLLEKGISPAYTEEEKLVHLTFDSSCVGEHLITTMAQIYSVNLNILLANVELLQDSTLGGIIGLISGEADNIAQALDFLKENGVEMEEFSL